tara:strand:+ start:7796 stop:7951 length:156 start_codon:yes stop_codon:yes gene_type:complete
MEDNDIIGIIDVLRKDNFYGAGEYTEIAKGKHEATSSFKGMILKIKRLIRK